MRNKYSEQFEQEMRRLAPSKTIQQLLKVANNKYCYPITKKNLLQYLSKRQIRYKDYNSNKAQLMGSKISIGTEYIKPDGMTLVKVAPNKWKYKQRLIYENYHNVQLTSNDYIIFLDQNRNNFNIDNLKCVTRQESSILSNQKLFSKNPIATETGIQVAKLMSKIKKGGDMNYFKRKRIQKGFKQSDMANLLEIDYKKYVAIEEGERKMPANLIDKFNKIIEKGKSEVKLDHLTREQEVENWLEEMRQPTDDGIMLQTKMKEFNVHTYKELANLIGYHSGSNVSICMNKTSGREVSYDFKNLLYSFFQNELNIQEKKEKKNEYAREYYKNLKNKEQRREQMKEYAKQKRQEQKEDYVSKQKLIDQCEQEIKVNNEKIDILQRQIDELKYKNDFATRFIDLVNSLS